MRARASAARPTAGGAACARERLTRPAAGARGRRAQLAQRALSAPAPRGIRCRSPSCSSSSACAAVLFAVLNGPVHSVAALPRASARCDWHLEVTVREHFSGYRSHALLLALLPVVVAAHRDRAGSVTTAARREIGAARARHRGRVRALQVPARPLRGGATPRGAGAPLEPRCRGPQRRLRAPMSEGSGRSSTLLGLAPHLARDGELIEPRDLALAFDPRRVLRGQVRDQRADAFPDLKREMGGGGAHQLAHVLDARPRPLRPCAGAGAPLPHSWSCRSLSVGLS